MQPRFHSSTGVVLDGIRRIVQALRVSGRQAEVELGLSGAQLFVLSKLSESDEALTLGELAARTLTDPSSVSAVVTRLVERGFALRSTSATDRRCIEIRLSAKGRSFLQRKLPETAQERLATAIDGLPPTKRAQLAELLGMVIAAAGFGTKDVAMFFEENHENP